MGLAAHGRRGCAGPPAPLLPSVRSRLPLLLPSLQRSTSDPPQPHPPCGRWYDSNRFPIFSYLTLRLGSPTGRIVFSAIPPLLLRSGPWPCHPDPLPTRETAGRFPFFRHALSDRRPVGATDVPALRNGGILRVTRTRESASRTTCPTPSAIRSSPPPPLSMVGSSTPSSRSANRWRSRSCGGTERRRRIEPRFQPRDRQAAGEGGQADPGRRRLGGRALCRALAPAGAPGRGPGDDCRVRRLSRRARGTPARPPSMALRVRRASADRCFGDPPEKRNWCRIGMVAAEGAGQRGEIGPRMLDGFDQPLPSTSSSCSPRSGIEGPASVSGP